MRSKTYAVVVLLAGGALGLTACERGPAARTDAAAAARPSPMGAARVFCAASPMTTDATLTPARRAVPSWRSTGTR
jgi:Flp pilus assembly protein CpaB